MKIRLNKTLPLQGSKWRVKNNDEVQEEYRGKVIIVIGWTGEPLEGVKRLSGYYKVKFSNGERIFVEGIELRKLADII